MLVFIAFAFIGLVLTVVSSFVGDDLEVHPEVEFSGVGFLSIRALAIFLMTFGTIGAIARWYQRTPLTSSLLGVLAGLLMYGLYIAAMALVKSQQASSLIADDDLVGATGTVTVAIPADGLGEVTCSLKSQTTRRLARSAGRRPIPAGTTVKISQLQGDALVVELAAP